MSHSPTSHTVFTPGPGLPLSQVIGADELERRPARAPDPAAENRALLRLAETLARTPHEVLQRLVDEARALCRADSAGINLFENAIPTGEGSPLRWKALSQGEALPAAVCEVLPVPFFRDGVAIGTVWIASHSEHRRFDAEDARIVEGLGQFAAAAIQVLEAKETEARQRRLARERGEFLATLAHELRNGLAPMSNAARVLGRAEDAQRRAAATEILERQIRQMNRLVEDLLDTSRLSSGKLRLKIGEVDLTPIVRAAAESIRSRIEQSGQSLRLDICETALPVSGDEIRLTQVFINLLTNAAKYGSAGGTITVSLKPEGKHAVVRVADTGVGIEPAMLSRVFDLFVQVDRTLTKSQGGLGIGLALVKRLVTMQGGSVAVHSDGLGKGSEFTVTLPLLRA